MTKKILTYIGISLVIILVLADTVATFSPRTIKLGASANMNSINLVPNTTVGGDTYALALNGSTVLDTNGNLSINDLQQGILGYVTLTTSTVLTPAQLCAATAIRVANTLANATITIAAATSTWAVCGINPGQWSVSRVINDSTNTVSVVAGTGDTFQYVTTGMGTTTYSGTNGIVPATSTMEITGQWDTSSTLYMEFGPTYH